mmetsp:Transcript_36985/g.110050  ORF Transcript_36985/g.110050 Transcript_36985/m.110050 type:complete len:297 (-) Transcript_36985:414-1304(-)
MKRDGSNLCGSAKTRGSWCCTKGDSSRISRFLSSRPPGSSTARCTSRSKAHAGGRSRSASHSAARVRGICSSRRAGVAPWRSSARPSSAISSRHCTISSLDRKCRHHVSASALVSCPARSSVIASSRTSVVLRPVVVAAASSRSARSASSSTTCADSSMSSRSPRCPSPPRAPPSALSAERRSSMRPYTNESSTRRLRQKRRLRLVGSHLGGGNAERLIHAVCSRHSSSALPKSFVAASEPPAGSEEKRQRPTMRSAAELIVLDASKVAAPPGGAASAAPSSSSATCLEMSLIVST